MVVTSIVEVNKTFSISLSTAFNRRIKPDI